LSELSGYENLPSCGHLYRHTHTHTHTRALHYRVFFGYQSPRNGGTMPALLFVPVFLRLPSFVCPLTVSVSVSVSVCTCMRVPVRQCLSQGIKISQITDIAFLERFICSFERSNFRHLLITHMSCRRESASHVLCLCRTFLSYKRAMKTQQRRSPR